MDIYRVMNGLVDNATSATLNTPDLKAMQEVAELVRSRADMPKEVIKLINTKLMKRDRKVTMLCLELLEYLTYSCEITLYNQISSKDFLMKVGTILKSHDLGEEVINRTCQLIKCWRDLFNKDLHQFFFQFYENAIKRGIEIPSTYNSPYTNLKAASSSASTFSNGAFKATIPSGSLSKVNQAPLSGPKAKLKADLDLVRENINLINEMIDGQDPKGNLEQNDSLCELLITLKSSETQMTGLIEKLAIENDEQMLELCLQLNDDMQSTFERQQSLKRHMKPKPFRSKGAEEDVMKKIEQLEITQKTNQSSASIFAETAQALSQGLAKAQGKSQIPTASFTSPPTFQPVQQPQPQQQVQKPVVVPPPKPAATNLIDLLDDDEPPVKIQQQTQPNVIPQQPQSFVPPPVNNNNVYSSVQPPTQIPTNNLPPQQQQQQQQPVSLTQLYQQNSNSQQAAQNKYQALNGFQQQQPQGYPGVQNGPYGQQSMVQGYQGMGQPMYGVNPQANLGYNTQPGYGMGYGTSPLPTVNTGYGTSSTFVSPQQTGGYGGGLPASNIPQANKPGYGAPAKKDAFDDLDDMFGIGSNAPASKPVKPAQTNVSPTFDLF